MEHNNDQLTIERYEGNGRMSRAVVHNNTMYLCGQTSRAEGAAAQTTEILNKIEDLLLDYGSDKQHILSATIYLKDISLFGEMNSVWDAWIEKGHEPARACVEAKLAAPELLVEISIIAALAPKSC